MPFGKLIKPRECDYDGSILEVAALQASKHMHRFLTTLKYMAFLVWFFFLVSSKSNKFIECRQRIQRFSSVAAKKKNGDVCSRMFSFVLALSNAVSRHLDLFSQLALLTNAFVALFLWCCITIDSHTILHSNNKQHSMFTIAQM